MRARLIGLALLACLLPRAAPAQSPPILFAEEPRTGFLTRYRAFISVEALAEPGHAFDGDADVGVNVDVLDFGHGRVNLSFNYEAVLGDELQPFDPNQGNYTLDTLATLRRNGTEIGLLFRHVSRHLGDRVKGFGIAWNDLGAELVHTRRAGPWIWRLRGFALATVMRGFVDYKGDLGGEVMMRRSLSTRASVIGSAGGHARLTKQARFERDTQTGVRADVGVRVEGEAGALELVVGVERRVDANAFELSPRQWVFAGARIMTK